MAFLFVLIFAGALVASLFGLGGGILYTPFQLWLGVPFTQATSTSLFLIMITSLSATFVFKKHGQVDFALALMLEIPTTVGAFAGGVVSHFFPEKLMGGLLVALILLASYLMIKPPSRGWNFCCRRGGSGGTFFWKREWFGEEYYLNLLCVFPLMFTVGALLSIVGISGGIMKIPIMVLLLNVPMPIAVGSSAFMVGLTAAAGFAGHLTVGHVNWRIAALLSVAVFSGAQLGSRLSSRLQGKRLRKLYGYFLIAVGFFTFFKLFLL